MASKPPRRQTGRRSKWAAAALIGVGLLLTGGIYAGASAAMASTTSTETSTLTVEDGKFGMWSADAPDCEIRDLTGCIVGPGLVDTHIHGFYNHATTDRSAEGINA